MTEEQVTKNILKWLIDNNWDIVAFDFPQSGTGIQLKRDDANDEKNKDSIIPDIISVKNGICTFWENKNRYYYPDFEKVNELRLDNRYKKAINCILKNYNIHKIYYGIGIPNAKYKGDAVEKRNMTDFIIGVEQNRIVTLYDINEIFE